MFGPEKSSLSFYTLVFLEAVSPNPPANMEDTTHSGELVRLQMTNTEEMMLACSCCGKYFSDSASLKTHLIFHKEDNIFFCSLCDKTFSQAGHLKTHMVLHKGEKPFNCNQCNKVFFKAVQWKRHKLSHLGEKPFGCTQCDTTFATQAELKSHSTQEGSLLAVISVTRHSLWKLA